MKTEAMKNIKYHPIKNALTRSLFIGLFALICSTTLTGQNELSKVNVYAEVGIIPGVEALANAEVRISSGNVITWYARAGLGAGGILLSTGGPGILGAITMLTGKGNNHFELSAGAFVGYDSYYSDTFVVPSLDLGYRFQKPGSGFIFKAKTGILGVGIGLGYAF